MTRQIHPLKDAKALISIIALMRQVKPDIVHLHSSKAGFLGRVAGFLLGRNKTVFYSPRGLSFLQQDVSKGKRTAYRRLERLASHLGGTVVACSRGELHEVETQLASQSSLLIENAVDTSLVLPKRPATDEVVRIGTVGRITAARNPELVARIAGRLIRLGIEFLWIGGGDRAGRRLLEASGVQVTGWLSRQEALQRLASLDIYVQASLWEGMPVSVIEAQVAGIPAVVTDILGNRDIVLHGETGYVAKGEADMVEYLERLIRQPDLRRALGGRARELGLQRFSLDRMLDELVLAYRAAVQ
jgi:glycosyltransferase involved in cell wall biosynthesis